MNDQRLEREDPQPVEETPEAEPNIDVEDPELDGREYRVPDYETSGEVEKQTSTWKAALVVALGTLLVLLFFPTTTVSRPGVLVPLTQDGTVNMLSVYEDRVPFITSLRCISNGSCFTLDSSVPKPGFPSTMEESLNASAIAAGKLADEPTPESPDIQGVTGPSGGLSLGIGHWLDLTGSKLGVKTAATGTLSVYGEVGGVAGIQAKSQLAQEDGVEVLIVPAGTKDLASGFTGTVLEAGTLQEAVDELCSLPSSVCTLWVKPVK